MNNWCKYCVYENDLEWQKECYSCVKGHDDITAPSMFLPRKDVHTQGDKIRQLNDLELSKFLPNKNMWNCPPDIKGRGGCPGACEPCWLRYLQSPVAENTL